MRGLVIVGMDDLAEIARFYFENDAEYKVAAFAADRRYRDADEFCGLPAVNFEEVEHCYPPEEYTMFIAIGYSHMNQAREEKYYAAKRKGYQLASYISTHATCLIGREQIGDNCFILEDNTIQPFVRIGNNVTMWSGNHIGHHAQIGDHVFITSHVVLSGRTCVKNNCFIGVNASVHDHVTIGDHCVVGSGALITRDTEPGSVYKREHTLRHEKKSSEIRYFGGNTEQ